MNVKPVQIGVIGCGNISDVYFRTSLAFPMLEVAACADQIPERAEAQARLYHLPRACSVDELLADPEIEIVVNLTPPLAHAEIALTAVAAGKSVYNEKPLAVDLGAAAQLLEGAASQGLFVGCAPDTFLGSSLQACRKLIEDGALGQPVGATAFLLSRGPESWHPDPEFFYKTGGGPMFDMGPYYLTALISLLGPAKRVTASARISYPKRVIGSKPHRGQEIQVEVPTYVSGVIDFQSGAVASLLTTFDVWTTGLPGIEVYGSEGSLRLGDPNLFGGPVHLRRSSSPDLEPVAGANPYDTNVRGLGVADMALAMREGRPHRANGQMAYHVLEIMHAFYEASASGQHVALSSTCDQPAYLFGPLA